MTQTSIEPAMVALVSLAASIAANHPGQGLCQLEKLRQHDFSEAQINLVIEIARHIRDEAGQKLDLRFDQSMIQLPVATFTPAPAADIMSGEACCSPSAKGKSCC